MSEPLEELRAQRDLIQQHLNWLDAQIASAEGSSDQTTPPTNQAATEAAAASAIKTPTVTVPAKIAPQEPTPSVAPALEFDEERHLSSGTSDVRRAQIGCFLIFAGGVLAFLFLLFGLPYLVD